MPRLLLAALTLATALGAGAEPWTGPIFDAHLHYNDDAVPLYSEGSAFELFRKNGVRAILANSRSSDGTRALHETRSRNAALGARGRGAGGVEEWRGALRIDPPALRGQSPSGIEF